MTRHALYTLACELSSLSVFRALLEELDSPWIVGCLDLGHCALVGFDPAECIRMREWAARL